VNFDWDTHWWVIVLLAVFAVPLVSALFEPWSRYLQYRRRRDALEVLKVYAAQNREPPPEVLDAVGGRRTRWRSAAGVAGNVAGNVAGVVAGSVSARAGDKWDRRWDRWEQRLERRYSREPIRRWNWAIFAGAITAGFGLAWHYAHANNDLYLIVAIIAGALTLAGVFSALLASFWRVD
jgi:hypothetical protein